MKTKWFEVYCEHAFGTQVVLDNSRSDDALKFKTRDDAQRYADALNERRCGMDRWRVSEHEGS